MSYPGRLTGRGGLGQVKLETGSATLSTQMATERRYPREQIWVFVERGKNHPAPFLSLAGC